MIASLVNIRFKQFYREILRIGLFRIVVLLGLTIMLFIFLFVQASQFPNALYTSIVILLLFFLLHIKRSDKLFLKINFSNYKWICFAEYTLVAFAFLVFLIIHSHWYLALLLVFALGVIVQLDFKVTRVTYNTRIQRWIPNECFEWKSGVRNLFILTLCIWLVGFLFSFFVASVPFTMVVLGIISLSFLEKGEPYQMIIAYEKAPNNFLLLKIRQLVALLTIVCAPLILSFLVFHYELWYIPFVILLMFCILQVYAIFVKYSFYEPNSNSPATQMFVGIGIVGFMVPVLAPLVILLALRFYFKAKQNLNFYLNDYD
ncbi:MAG: hypothetical protein PHE03_03395 [Bacteroidales bacterium]|nr:hypothetical protein [Bacteroidales bacterium]MDD3891325.1 hypothetical protein [Bacteroidales bacterium]